MSEPTDPACPECGTPRPADGSLACSCARRASDAHRAARTAEAAAAEDFDPVRIRPFVEIGDEPPGEPADEPADGPEGSQPPPLPSSLSDAEEPSEPSATEPAEQTAAPHLQEPAPSPSDAVTRTPSRRRPVLLATGVGATAAVLLTGCLVGGFHWYDSPERDDSQSGGVRAGLPDGQPTGTDPSSPAPSRSAPSEQPTPSSSPSPDTTSTSDPPTPTGPAGPTGTTSSTAGATARPTASAPEDAAPVLRLGDQGPEVTELQLRLRQTGFYGGEADGTYDRDVENAVRGYQLTRVVLADEPGVYGSATRASLESETSQP